MGIYNSEQGKWLWDENEKWRIRYSDKKDGNLVSSGLFKNIKGD